MEDNSTYRIPAGFNPWQTLDAIRGLSGDAIRHFLIDGPGSPEHTMSHSDRADIDGLLHVLQHHVHALHAYFTAIGDFSTLRLPLTDADFDRLHVRRGRKDEVKEPAAVYLIR